MGISFSNIKFEDPRKDSWFSMINDPFRHPDKAGHFVIHLVITIVALLLIHPWWMAVVIDLVINALNEVVDGTRPRRRLFFNGFRICFNNQTQYEDNTIEGWSHKDFIAGLVGSALALTIFFLFIH